VERGIFNSSGIQPVIVTESAKALIRDILLNDQLSEEKNEAQLGITAMNSEGKLQICVLLSIRSSLLWMSSNTYKNGLIL